MKAMKQRKQKTGRLREGKIFWTQIILQWLPFQGNGNSSHSSLGKLLECADWTTVRMEGGRAFHGEGLIGSGNWRKPSRGDVARLIQWHASGGRLTQQNHTLMTFHGPSDPCCDARRRNLSEMNHPHLFTHEETSDEQAEECCINDRSALFKRV